MTITRLAAAGLFLMAALPAAAQLKSGIDQSNFDQSIRPQDDFYRYVNGTWLKKTEIPADKSNYGSFSALADQAEKDLLEIIQESSGTKAKKGTEAQLVGDLYTSFMDTVSIEKAGLKPLRQELDRIQAVKSREELNKLVASLYKSGIQAPFSLYITQDEKNPEVYIPYINQSGLGLPDRDFYFKKEDKFVGYRTAYIQYLEKMLTLAGSTNPAKSAETILAIETDIAGYHWTRVQNRDREKTYNMYTLADLQKATPGFDWSVYLKEIGIKNPANLIVSQPSYLDGFNTVWTKYPVEDWKTYFTLKTVRDFAEYLSSDFVTAQFNFYSKTLRGVEQMQPRWKRGVNLIDENLGEAAGKVYVSKHFKPEAKKRMAELVTNLKAALKVRIEKLEWMSPETKTQALDKLANFTTKIGYPDKWKDYSGLSIDKKDLVGNVMRSVRFQFDENISRLGKPVDKTEWFMTPQTVNAYYNPVANEIVFPAAILQPPFFDLEADDAVNYGAIGAVIGHEISHGFDDQGRLSDGNGVLRDWWTEKDAGEYNKRADMLVDQYNQFSPIDTMKVNGRFTLGENIGDLAGMTIAFTAYQMALNGKPAPVIDGFTGEQRFFLGWGQIWRRKYRDDELRNRLLTDPHSPSEYRCNGIVANLEPFYAAFGVKAGDKLYRGADQRVKIW